MARFEHVNTLHRLLRTRRYPVSLPGICDALECSESTAKRTIHFMRNALDAPIVTKVGHGYFYDLHQQFELPGIWFTPDELHALLSIQQLTEKFSGGVFTDSMRLIHRKAESLLGDHLPEIGEMRRIRVLSSGSRGKQLPAFPAVAGALLERHRLMLIYHGRQRGEASEREVSPQRLVYYKGNWYLDAWCHQADGMRTFALERIRRVQALNVSCRECPDAELDVLLASSFGIFSGKAEAMAVLCFSEKAARWAADEEWFPDVECRWLEGRRLELRIPYHNPIELIMEICRYGSGVEVVGPPELRQQVADILRAAADQYR